MLFFSSLGEKLRYFFYSILKCANFSLNILFLLFTFGVIVKYVPILLIITHITIFNTFNFRSCYSLSIYNIKKQINWQKIFINIFSLYYWCLIWIFKKVHQKSTLETFNFFAIHSLLNRRKKSPIGLDYFFF